MDNVISRALLEDKAKSINHLKNEIALNVIEIGRHLKEAKEICFDNGQTWQTWTIEKCDFTKRQADSYIKVYDRLGQSVRNGNTCSHILGMSKIELLAQLPDEINIPDFIEEHQPENKTVKELAMIVRQSKGIDETERLLIQEKARAEAKIEIESQVKSFLAEKENNIDQLEKRLYDLQKENQSIKQNESHLTKQLNEEIKNRKKYMQIQNDIKELQKRRETMEDEISEMRQLVDIKFKVKDLIKVLSPVRYSSIFNLNEMNEITRQTVYELTDEVQAWIDDIMSLLKNNIKIVEVS